MDADNQQDAYLMARQLLATRVAPEMLEQATAALVTASKGLFVYLSAVGDRLPPKITSVEQIRSLPHSLDGLYLQFFELQQSAGHVAAAHPLKIASITTSDSPRGAAAAAAASAACLAQTADVLHVLVAAQEPPGIDDICWALDGAAADHVEVLLAKLTPFYVFEVLQGTRRAVATHKSIVDFLTDASRSGAHFVDPAAAHRRLAAACLAEVRKLRADDVHTACLPQLGAHAAYIVRHAVMHCRLAGDTGLLAELCTNLLFVRAAVEAGAGFQLVAALAGAAGSSTALSSKAGAACSGRDAVVAAMLRFLRVVIPEISDRPELLFGLALNAPDDSNAFSAVRRHEAEHGLSLAQCMIDSRKPQSVQPWLLVCKCSTSSTVWGVSLCDNGSLVAAGSDDNKVRLFDTSTGELLQVLRGHNRKVFSVSLSGDGGLLACGGALGEVRIWRTADGELLRKLNDYTAVLRCCALSPDGKRLATASADKTCRVYDNAESGECLHVLQNANEVSGSCKCVILPKEKEQSNNQRLILILSCLAVPFSTQAMQIARMCHMIRCCFETV